MTPLRAAVLLALEQECRARMVPPAYPTNERMCVWRGGALVSRISARVVYPGLVRASAIRVILREELAAGRVLLDDSQTAHRWWPVGLCQTLIDERVQAQKEWFAAVENEAKFQRKERHMHPDLAKAQAVENVTRRIGPCP